MAYTPYTWQDAASGNTPITAARLNAIEQGIYQASLNGGTNTGGMTVSALGFNPLDYGAKGDGVSIDRGAIQSAMDAAATKAASTGVQQSVYIPNGTFLLDAVLWNPADPGAGAMCLGVRNNINIVGPGTLKVKAGAYGNGANFSVLRNVFGVALSNVTVQDITIDGNKQNNVASQQCNNIGFEVNTNVQILHTTQIAANGNGMILYGGASQLMTNVVMSDNFVSGATMIGIQGSRFDGLLIQNNRVEYCTNNAIDVYGNNPDQSSAGKNFIISGNNCKFSLIGIFPESCTQGVVSNNICYGMFESGVHINRINTAPGSILVVNNQFSASPRGVWVTGDASGGVVIQNNLMVGHSVAGVQLGGTGGNCSYVWVLDNNINTATYNNTPLVLATGNQIAFCTIRRTTSFNSNRSWDYVEYQVVTSVGNTATPANA